MYDAQKPRLIVVAGPNGSGKTTITEKLLRHEWMDGCQYSNPDVIAQQEFGDWNSPVAVIQAAKKAKASREHCLTHNISWPLKRYFPPRKNRIFSCGQKMQDILFASSLCAPTTRQLMLSEKPNELWKADMMSQFQKSSADIIDLLQIA